MQSWFESFLAIYTKSKYCNLNVAMLPSLLALIIKMIDSLDSVLHRMDNFSPM